VPIVLAGLPCEPLRGITRTLPIFDMFPYSLRSVPETPESNGSLSMATVCGTNLALMDARVMINGRTPFSHDQLLSVPDRHDAAGAERQPERAADLHQLDLHQQSQRQPRLHAQELP